MTRQTITPHLWYDKEGIEAADFYVSAFGRDSKINYPDTMDDTPSGSVDTVNFSIWGYEFTAINAGSHFDLNPSISFL